MRSDVAMDVYISLYKRLLEAGQHFSVGRRYPIILKIGMQGPGPVFLGRVIGGEDIFFSTFVQCLCHQCSKLHPGISKPGSCEGQIHWLQNWILHADSSAGLPDQDDDSYEEKVAEYLKNRVLVNEQPFTQYLSSMKEGNPEKWCPWILDLGLSSPRAYEGSAWFRWKQLAPAVFDPDLGVYRATSLETEGEEIEYCFHPLLQFALLADASKPREIPLTSTLTRHVLKPVTKQGQSSDQHLPSAVVCYQPSTSIQHDPVPALSAFHNQHHHPLILSYSTHPPPDTSQLISLNEEGWPAAETTGFLHHHQQQPSSALTPPVGQSLGLDQQQSAPSAPSAPQLHQHTSPTVVVSQEVQPHVNPRSFTAASMPNLMHSNSLNHHSDNPTLHGFQAVSTGSSLSAHVLNTEAQAPQIWARGSSDLMLSASAAPATVATPHLRHYQMLQGQSTPSSSFSSAHMMHGGAQYSSRPLHETGPNEHLIVHQVKPATHDAPSPLQSQHQDSKTAPLPQLASLPTSGASAAFLAPSVSGQGLQYAGIVHSASAMAPGASVPSPPPPPTTTAPLIQLCGTADQRPLHDADVFAISMRQEAEERVTRLPTVGQQAVPAVDDPRHDEWWCNLIDDPAGELMVSKECCVIAQDMTNPISLSAPPLAPPSLSNHHAAQTAVLRSGSSNYVLQPAVPPPCSGDAAEVHCPWPKIPELPDGIVQDEDASLTFKIMQGLYKRHRNSSVDDSYLVLMNLFEHISSAPHMKLKEMWEELQLLPDAAEADDPIGLHLRLSSEDRDNIANGIICCDLEKRVELYRQLQSIQSAIAQRAGQQHVDEVHQQDFMGILSILRVLGGSCSCD
ncbi:hypothetical protein CEUSTIGMA_g3276.t1 [Chlamydomonas eustigma]|uniref:Uncharacterized protein n=1 Tax=Chlamydomonas eustigma TaxID=1157962 RepID=A0A250WYB5_9CHLO|nr:hypothetical protein CEUSTIGMA_g3276.t1 [Chlamydomonas eustigma]|eukprot:GAX75833.1 hypothetical protein CEUSTIGMA_g3276.t1 [Chlamydomonas eustigma]